MATSDALHGTEATAKAIDHLEVMNGYADHADALSPLVFYRARRFLGHYAARVGGGQSRFSGAPVVMLGKRELILKFDIDTCVAIDEHSARLQLVVCTSFTQTDELLDRLFAT